MRENASRLKFWHDASVALGPYFSTYLYRRMLRSSPRRSGQTV